MATLGSTAPAATARAVARCVLMRRDDVATVDAHSGYDFCVLDKLPFLFFWGGNKHHDIHHQKPKTNFQPFFTWFDIYHGTNCNIGSNNATASRKKKGE